ncbi:hypothetical protein M422DRAFT_234885 [Sphaerobolus stellatus SS14]|uniref:Heterokaryon incompatibility domain-containing protein n=1 Tax=Sphaerobolus stellatus (strain SS14) TaxID=990650 RepID=A0A0C9U7H4_SPHS4|nr:hypothetical protein M422DRAFT_234885 [Sphaerobolus stellatus SS14]
MEDFATIIKIPLENLKMEVPIDVGSSSTPCRYRLVDCISYIDKGNLHIIESSNFPAMAYSAISYVWRGNPADPTKVGPAFMVQGAPDADPISVNVLKNACHLSIQRGINYLWLDRLCILQDNSEDKKWQIKEMYRMYLSCELCIILPGGVQRLVRLDEETAWIHRGWTLQEALAPKEVVVLFAWEVGSGKIQTGDDEGILTEVISEHSGVSPLGHIINACTLGYIIFISTTGKILPDFRISVRIFGTGTANIKALASLNSEIIATSIDVKNHAIWKSALLRTSQRPVDMVFSIMGLFGITLDTRKYGKNDRIRATIDLVREILENGGSASWLGMSFHLPPCKEFCTFPIFPMTSVAGKALIEDHAGFQRDIADFVVGEYPNELGFGCGLPGGTMSEDSYFTFSTKSVIVEPASRSDDSGEHKIIVGIDESAWTVHDTINDHGSRGDNLNHYLAVLIGWFDEYYPGSTSIDNKNKIKGMIVKLHAPGRYHLVSYFALHFQDRPWVISWRECEVSVGSSQLKNKEDLPFRCINRKELDGNSKNNKGQKHLDFRMKRSLVPQKFLEAMPRKRT